MRDTDLIDAFRDDASPPREEVRIRARARLLEQVALDERRGGPPRRRPVRRLVGGVVGLSAALAAAVVLLVVEPWQPTGETAVARAATMVSPEPRTVLHIRMDGHRISSPFFEQWIAPDGSWRELHGGSDPAGPCTIEDGYDASSRTASTYDPRTRTVYSLPLPPAQARLAQLDPMAKVREWLSGGRLRAAGDTLLDGRPVTRLVPTHGTSLFGAIAYYVDARTGRPVRWQVDATQWYDFTTYERLPATPRDLRLASLQDQHPQAAARHGWGATGGCASG
jgi:hypothetical protein